MIKCVIFDMDGLLSDTEELHFESYQHALNEFGVQLDFEDYVDYWINQGKGLRQYLKERQYELPIDSIRALKNEFFIEQAKKGVKLFEGSLDALDFLSNHNILLALASSASLNEINAVLNVTATKNFFSLIVGKEDVENVKPKPDLFLKVAEELNVKPSDCIVLEDAEKGAEAASLAGMQCIVIPNKYTKGKIKTKIKMSLSSLKSINFDELLK